MRKKERELRVIYSLMGEYHKKKEKEKIWHRKEEVKREIEEETSM